MSNIELSKTELSVLINSLTSNSYRNGFQADPTTGLQDQLLAKLIKERNK